MKRKIAIVAGGDSSENPVSLRSAATILEYMDKDKYEPYILEIEGKNWQVHTSALPGRERRQYLTTHT